jgi:hypothetical protein
MTNKLTPPPFDTYHEFGYPNAIIVTFNEQIADENVWQYEFVNLSNVPVTVNGMFLDRYFSGANPLAPTVIAGSNNRWAPVMLAGERDTTSYAIIFQDTYYPGAVPYHKLIVMKKQLQPMPYNREPERR